MQSATVTLGQYNGRTRLFSLSLSTNQGRSISAGTPTSERYIFTAPTGWHIAGFTGRAGDEHRQAWCDLPEGVSARL
ncbi:hypothetical protein ADT25_19520 [Xanthomonas oryzae]|uniref:Jacalin-type lectin domain-containing protein n=1 Tax=Xanthomonas oryzae TaxID=347 RepID=A0AAP0ZI23_9XANT|nr:hypothetical protein ADT25_19520 [Xanthomonas oryzae]